MSFICTLLVWLSPGAPGVLPATELGVAHIGGCYPHATADFLNEGAAAAQQIGAHCLKVSLSLDSENPSPQSYRLHLAKTPQSLVELAQTKPYQTLFARPFDTFVLTSFRPGKPAGYWREEFTVEDEHAEEECFARLTDYLLRTYSTSGKTFILQNWEGDWALRGKFDPKATPTPEATARMIQWLQARQRGVASARAAFAGAGAHVYHACEVNLVRQAIEKGAPSVTTDVLPQTDVDLASYSSWDTVEDPTKFADALAFIARHKKPTPPFGEHGVYVGEFGLPETGHTSAQVLERTSQLLRVAQDHSCPYAIYWQIYCNEPLVPTPQTNADFKGFWLIRPDGSRSPVCSLFH